MSDILIHLQNRASRRFVMLEDDGESAWLYLTEPDQMRVVASLLVYNRVPPISRDRVKDYRGGPPPIADVCASSLAVLQAPDEHMFDIKWSKDGESVCLFIDKRPWAMIIGAAAPGYGRGIAREGPWGNPWKQDLCGRVFG